jgi:hypothetical protein
MAFSARDLAGQVPAVTAQPAPVRAGGPAAHHRTQVSAAISSAASGAITRR